MTNQPKNLIINNEKIIATIAESLDMMIEMEYDSWIPDGNYESCIDIINAMHAIGSHDDAHKYAIKMLNDLQKGIQEMIADSYNSRCPHDRA